MRKKNGFTLLELMIVVAIIGILAAIAVPIYKEYINKSRRSDAQVAISATQQAQEKWRANNTTYSENFGKTGLNLDTSADSVLTLNSNEKYYKLVVTVGTATASAYTLVATAQGKQATSDTKCNTLTLVVSNGNATRTSKDSSGNTSTGCW